MFSHNLEVANSFAKGHLPKGHNLEVVDVRTMLQHLIYAVLRYLLIIMYPRVATQAMLRVNSSVVANISPSAPFVVGLSRGVGGVLSVCCGRCV